MTSKGFVLTTIALLVAGLGVGVAIGVQGAQSSAPPSAAQRADYADVVPAPVSAVATGGQFTITASTHIYVTATTRADTGANAGANASASNSPSSTLNVANYLAALLRTATGYAIPVTPTSTTPPNAPNGIRLVVPQSTDAQLGPEGYRLDVTADQISVTASQPAGLFHGVQTLRQLLPPQAEQRAKPTTPATPLAVPDGHILDYPRYTYRAAGLDVARHFFSVADVERYIDEVSLYKVDYLHLHLTDDQGWRLAINGWPKLTAVGAATEVGGGAGGFYTQDDFRKLVAYARSRYITIVPEIDMPGHVTAALASYAALSCDGKPRQVFTGIAAPYSSLCAGKKATYAFIDDVFRQLAALTPGQYVGIGGDEAQATSASDYAKIVDRAASDVRVQGKIPWGWEETVAASVGTPAVATYWNTGAPAPGLEQAANSGTQLVLDPANHTYLDQKYTPDTVLGLKWAGYVDVRNAYDWNPATYLSGSGVKPPAILGVEADLWTETIASSSDIDYMLFPRLPAIAELGWSPATTHDWTAFRQRLAAQAPRWTAMGINYYRSTQVPWPPGR